MTLTERDLYQGYGITVGPVPPRSAVRAHATETVLLERIAELVRFRRWYRQQANWSWWTELAQRNDVELRGLLRVARLGRRLTAAAPDPIDTSARWHEYLDR